MDGYGYRLDPTWVDGDLEKKTQLGRTAWQKIVRQLTRYRYQTLGGILVAIILPAALKGRLPELFGGALLGNSFDNALLGSVVAFVLGFLIYRKMTGIPGANAITNVIPAFLGSYALVAAFFLILRLDYSRFQLLGSFLLAICWFTFIQLLIAKLRRPRFGLVGDQNTLLQTAGANVEFEVLDAPEMAEREGKLPLVVDFESSTVDNHWQRYLSEAVVSGRPVFDSEAFFESTQGRVRILNLAKHSIGQTPTDSIYEPAKRYTDAVISIVALLALLPLLVFLALWIKLDSPGPVFFIQKRVGHRGRTFSMIKFRSMTSRPGLASSLEGDVTKDGDQRITRVGKFIRKVRIDEIPQLINVIMGEMSIIGPRPETIHLSKLYEAEIPNYRYRHVVRPGITGWAQVRQGHVAAVGDAEEKLEYDFFYVKNFSLWLDLLIAYKTLRVMLTGFGAK